MNLLSDHRRLLCGYNPVRRNPYLWVNVDQDAAEGHVGEAKRLMALTARMASALVESELDRLTYYGSKERKKNLRRLLEWFDF